MKVFGRIGAGVAMAAALLAGTALAQGPGGGMGPGFGEHRPPMERAFERGGFQGRWWNNPKAVEQLKLTDAQRKEFDSIFLAHRENLIDLRAGLEKAELALEPLVSDDQPNEGKILAQIDKVAQARAELEKANARFLLALRAKLSPEQWKQVQAFRAHHGEEHRGAGHDGPGAGRWKQGGPGHGMMNHHPVPPQQEGAEPQAPPAQQPGAEQ